MSQTSNSVQSMKRSRTEAAPCDKPNTALPDVTDTLRQKEMKLPNRQANPRRLQLWQTLNTNKTLFDVCLRGSDREVACNSLLLAEESQFFTAKFSNPDFAGPTRLVELQDVDGDTLETVVAALLTATIKLDSTNIERILHCADMLQLSAVKDACCMYMQNMLDEKHAASTLSLAAKYSCDSLLDFTSNYIAANFHTMAPCALKECSRALFFALINRDDLSVHSELQVLTAITAWCNHNSALHTFEELFSAVRLEHMQQYELHVISQHVMADHTFVQERLAAALATAADPEPARTPNAEQRKQRQLRESPETCSREAAFMPLPDRLRPATRAARFSLAGQMICPAARQMQGGLHDGLPERVERLNALMRGGRQAIEHANANAAAAPGEEDEDLDDATAAARGRRTVRRRMQPFRR